MRERYVLLPLSRRREDGMAYRSHYMCVNIWFSIELEKINRTLGCSFSLLLSVPSFQFGMKSRRMTEYACALLLFALIRTLIVISNRKQCMSYKQLMTRDIGPETCTRIQSLPHFRLFYTHRHNQCCLWIYICDKCDILLNLINCINLTMRRADCSTIEDQAWRLDFWTTKKKSNIIQIAHFTVSRWNLIIIHFVNFHKFCTNIINTISSFNWSGFSSSPDYIRKKNTLFTTHMFPFIYSSFFVRNLGSVTVQ